MSDVNVNAVPKVHPASRETMPEDPMELTGFEIPGDTDLMLRLLVEEYARIGWGSEQIMQLARDPFYQGFHGLLRLHGEAELQRRVTEILARFGVRRVSVREQLKEREPDVIQIQMPTM